MEIVEGLSINDCLIVDPDFCENKKRIGLVVGIDSTTLGRRAIYLKAQVGETAASRVVMDRKKARQLIAMLTSMCDLIDALET